MSLKFYCLLFTMSALSLITVPGSRGSSAVHHADRVRTTRSGVEFTFSKLKGEAYQFGKQQSGNDRRTGFRYASNAPVWVMMHSYRGENVAQVKKVLQYWAVAPKDKGYAIVSSFLSGYVSAAGNDPDRPIIAQSTKSARLSNLHLAILRYILAYRGAMPNMTSSRAMDKSLKKYVSSSKVFVDPRTGIPWQPNTKLNGKSAANCLRQDVVLANQVTSSKFGLVLMGDGDISIR